MSKGLGKWERLILATVNKDGFAWVGSVADGQAATLAAKQAAGRATTSLAKKGLIESGRYYTKLNQYKLVAYLPGKPPATRPPQPLEIFPKV